MNWRVIVFSMAWGLVMLATVPVAAQETDDAASGESQEQQEQQEQPERQKPYAAQLLAADAAGLGLGMGAMAFDNSNRDAIGNLALISGSMYGSGVLTGPTIHWANGRTGAGFASLVMRAAVPPVSAIVGLSTYCLGTAFAGDDFADGCARDGAVVGSFVSQLGVSALDAVGIAKMEERQKRSSRGKWYGWQTLAIDAVGLGLGTYVLVRANQSDDPPDDIAYRPFSIGMGSWLTGWLAAPFVHAFHGEWMMAFTDFGMRGLTVPSMAAMGIAGYCGASGGEDDCAAVGAGWGFLGGALLVASLDATVLAYESSDEPDAETMSLQLAPSLQWSDERFTLSLGGRF